MHNPRTEEEIISSWKEGVNKPVVSVCCITYNHVQHIRKAIESILAQETSFSIEVLLGEDSSFDGTQEIVFEYHKAYPTIIKVFVHDRADVIYVNGSPTGRWNYFDTLENAQGKYIAYIEGDDYWTDPLKLQKQVELMESRPDVSVCGHLVINVDERDELLQSQTCTGVGCPTELSVISAMTSTPIHPNSWLFRKVSLRKHPAYPLLLKLPAGDDPLILVLLGMGKGYCIPEYMSAYRLHSGGTWHTKHVIIKRFSMLQFQLSINELVEKKYWLRWGWNSTYHVTTFFAHLILPLFRGDSKQLQLFMQAMGKQDIVTIPSMIFWAAVSVPVLPMHMAIYLYKKWLGFK